MSGITGPFIAECIRKGCSNPCPNGGLVCASCLAGSAGHHGPVLPGKSCAPFPGRVTLELPWSALASDNRGGRADFDAAKAKAAVVLREQYQFAPFAGPARVTVLFFVPNEIVRDLWNFGKLIGDALKGIVLTDDRWKVLRTATVDFGGVDCDRPRAEITVEVRL